MTRLFVALLALVCATAAVAQTKPATATLPAGLDPQNTILLDTAHGRVIIKLRPDLAPQHAERIKTLAREKFYDNAPFHRVIAGFMAQTGDGSRGDGTGGSKYPNLPAEFSNVPFKRGVVGMARFPIGAASSLGRDFENESDMTLAHHEALHHVCIDDVAAGVGIDDVLERVQNLLAGEGRHVQAPPPNLAPTLAEVEASREMG